MKRLIKCLLLGIFLICSIQLVTSCSQNKEKPTGALSLVEANRSSVEVEAKITDPDVVITLSSIQVRLIDKNDEQVGTGAAFSDSDDPTLGPNEVADRVIIKNLNSNTTYRAELICTVDSDLITLATIEVSTNQAGDTESDPIYINNINDLNKIKNDLSAYYVLNDDLDYANETGNKTIQKPLFSNSSSEAFTGTFDGKGHTIKNFKQEESYAYYGFFGYLSEGVTIKNVNFTGVEINSTRYSETKAGVVAATISKNSTIENVHVSDSTINLTTSSESAAMYIGGFVGENNEANIKNSSVSNVSITVSARRYSYVGGFMGRNINNAYSTVINCSADTDIWLKQIQGNETATDSDKQIVASVGGFVGINTLDGRIYDSFSTGTIKASLQLTVKELKDMNTQFNLEVGGFVGINYGKINQIAVKESIDVTSFDAYVVQVGTIAGALANRGVINEAVYIGKGEKVRLVLAADDIKDLTEDDLKGTSSEDVKPDDEENAPTYERKYNLATIGSISQDETELVAYSENPTIIINTTLISNPDFKGTASSYENFKLSDNLKAVIQSWLA